MSITSKLLCLDLTKNTMNAGIYLRSHFVVFFSPIYCLMLTWRFLLISGLGLDTINYVKRCNEKGGFCYGDSVTVSIHSYNIGKGHRRLISSGNVPPCQKKNKQKCCMYKGTPGQNI